MEEHLPQPGSTSVQVQAKVFSKDGLSGFLDMIAAELHAEKCDMTLANRILLVIEELVINAFDHGNASAVETSVTLHDDCADLAVTHDGTAFDTSSLENVPPLDPHTEGGLGLRIVHHLAHPLSYAREGGLNLTKAAVR